MKVNISMIIFLEDLVFFIILVHHLLVFISAKMSDHHILTQPAVDLFHKLVRIKIF